MTIAGLSTNISTSGITNDIQIAMLKKNLDTVEDVYEFLIKNHFDRKDMLVALGGGVVGDLTKMMEASVTPELGQNIDLRI